MAGERYMLYQSEIGWKELRGTFRPSGSAPVSRNLVRARGHTRIFDLSDGLPEPQLITLTGIWRAQDEHILSAELDWWSWFVATCTQMRRADRAAVEIQGGSLVWAPVEFDSSEATVTITLIPEHVKDPKQRPSGGVFWFLGESRRNV